MQRYIIKNNLFLILGFSSILFSCGSPHRLVQVQPTSWEVVQEHLAKADFVLLLEDLEIYPEFRDQIESKIYSWPDYSSFSYSQLRKFDRLAENDYSASVFFDSLMVARQEETLATLSRLDLDAIGDFYRTNGKDHDYLHDALKESFFSDLDEMDYKTLKAIHKAFQNTDLSSLVDPIYSSVRTGLLEGIMEEVSEYFAVEDEIIAAVEDNLRSELEEYVESGVVAVTTDLSERIDRGLLKRTFRRKEIDNYSISELTGKLIGENLDQRIILGQIQEAANEIVSSTTEIRRELIVPYLSDAGTSSGYYIPKNILSAHSLDIEGESENKAVRIQSVKQKGEAVSLASIALMFTPAGAVGLALDAWDLYNGFTEDSKVRTLLDSFSDQLYSEYVEGIDNYISAVFKTLDMEKTTTKTYIIERINEDF